MNDCLGEAEGEVVVVIGIVSDVGCQGRIPRCNRRGVSLYRLSCIQSQAKACGSV